MNIPNGINAEFYVESIGEVRIHIKFFYIKKFTIYSQFIITCYFCYRRVFYSYNFYIILCIFVIYYDFY